MSVEFCAGIRITFEPTCNHCVDELSDLMSGWCEDNGIEWDTIYRLVEKGDIDE